MKESFGSGERDFLTVVQLGLIIDSLLSPRVVGFSPLASLSLSLSVGGDWPARVHAGECARAPSVTFMMRSTLFRRFLRGKFLSLEE